MQSMPHTHPVPERPQNDVEAALTSARSRFIRRNPKSLELHEKAVKILPGGNTRSILYTTPFPVSMKHGKGHELTDEDGNTYVDFVGELSAGLYGHSNTLIRKVIIDTIDNVGLTLGATTAQEAKYAELLCSRFQLEQVRFCNSGTEANLHALAAARKYTGKRRIVVFGGSYHGAVLSFGGGYAAPNNVDIKDWIVARYNDIDSAREAIRSEGIAAVLLEGMLGAGGAIPATTEFLKAVQEAAREARVLFILDEVMTSRLSSNGIAGLCDLDPDLKTFGKYLGAGLAFGMFGGKADVMSVFDPRDPEALAHSGTFNNNTLAMHAGHAALSQLFTAIVCTELNLLGDWLRTHLAGVTKGTKCCFTGRGSIMAAHFSDSGEEMEKGDGFEERMDLKDLFWMEMMEDGFWITRRGSIALILGTPQSTLEHFIGSVQAFLKRHRSLMAIET